MKPPSGGPIIGRSAPPDPRSRHQRALSIDGSTSLPPAIIAPPMLCGCGDREMGDEEDNAQPIEPTVKTAMATENTMRAPNRSAVQPLAGMNTASDSRYEVMASFSVNGLVPMSAAIAGSEVAITVESMFSMNRAVATMSGIRRSLVIGIRGEEWEKARERAVSPHRHWSHCGTRQTT
jgi:hypothetical protein